MSVSELGQFQTVKEKGWKRGLGNLLQGEYSAWFKSSRWWKQLILWILIVNGMMLIMIYANVDAAKEGSEGPPLMLMYGIFGGMFVAIGVMVIMQRVLVGEKNSGTAAWVLSKPVTRTSFVISRLVVNSIAILLTSIIVPGVILYVTFGLLTNFGWLSPAGFLASLAIFSIHTFYWIAMVLMLGTFFESSAAVIAIPIALFFTFWMGNDLLPKMIYVSPLLLTYSPNPVKMNSIAASILTGGPVLTWLPLIFTAIFGVAFVIVAVWRFNRQEF